MSDPFAAVATRFIKELGVEPVELHSGYRGLAESPLEGEWLGGYSDPRMLEAYSPMRVVFAGEHATAEDDGGESEWTLLSNTERAQTWRKKYPRRARELRGRKLPHAFVGAWTDPDALRDRMGCFWLVPASRLSTRHAAKLRRAAKRRFWPSGGAQAFSFLMIGASVPSIAFLPWWLFPLPFALIWFALKDAMDVTSTAERVLRELDEPLRARVLEDEDEDGDEDLEALDFDEDSEEEASSSAST